eukprot:CAMPEP_0198708624 /NCGR_PEP_ID=MMETSP1471-20131121/1223_1 /TAXON_ID=41880 /ORGANISM="Pycnococcus provasolii, Strain RCC733" /LENGTH=106 /DNA_ID=CAMNT_0044467895 /DNA_START=173 /DNA_END=493 /DNA_ORIENTATION=+
MSISCLTTSLPMPSSSLSRTAVHTAARTAATTPNGLFSKYHLNTFGLSAYSSSSNPRFLYFSAGVIPLSACTAAPIKFDVHGSSALHVVSSSPVPLLEKFSICFLA